MIVLRYIFLSVTAHELNNNKTKRYIGKMWKEKRNQMQMGNRETSQIP